MLGFEALAVLPLSTLPDISTGSKGRRLVSWLIDIPMVPNPLGEYVWRREEEDEIFVLFGQ